MQHLHSPIHNPQAPKANKISIPSFTSSKPPLSIPGLFQPCTPRQTYRSTTRIKLYPHAPKLTCHQRRHLQKPLDQDLKAVSRGSHPRLRNQQARQPLIVPCSPSDSIGVSEKPVVYYSGSRPEAVLLKRQGGRAFREGNGWRFRRWAMGVIWSLRLRRGMGVGRFLMFGEIAL